jgi:hypothetical protein
VNNSNSFISNLFGKKMFKVKRKSRPINTIVELKKQDGKMIQIRFIDKKDKTGVKTIVYECATLEHCSELFAKINFLLVSFFNCIVKL